MTAPIDTDVAVVGGGPAGVSAAIATARGDLAVTLVSEGPIQTPPTLLGWRVLERTVDRHRARGSVTRAAVWDEARAERTRLAALRTERLTLRLADAGVDVVRGRARFEHPTRLAVEGGPSVHFDRAIVAVGSTPKTLSDGGDPIATPATLFDRLSLPEEVMVIGGGAAGAELVDALSLIDDVTVTWVMDEVGILPRFDRELAEIFGDVLLGRGVKLVHGKAVTSVESKGGSAHAKLDGGRTYTSALAVICAGQGPAPADLNLSAAEVETLRVEASLQTSSSRIWAAGECTGRCPSAAHASAMGRAAGRAVADLGEADWDPTRVPLVVRGHPQLAAVGATPERLAGQNVVFHTARGEETLAGLLAGLGERADAKGFVRVACDSQSGSILGLTAAGPGAAACASAAAIALASGATEDTLAQVQGGVPSVLEALLFAVP